MSDNKIRGIVKAVSEDKGGILLLTKDDQNGLWWNGVGEKAKNQVKKGLRGSEVELTVVNLEKRMFSYVNVLNSRDVPKKGEICSNEETRLRSMALSYVKDLVINDKVALEDMESYASRFLTFIRGNIIPRTKVRGF